MDNLSVLLGEALSRPLGWLAVVLIVGAFIGYLTQREAGSSMRLAMLLGILAGFVLLGLSVHQAKTDLDSSLPQRSSLQAPRFAAVCSGTALGTHVSGREGEVAHGCEAQHA